MPKFNNNFFDDEEGKLGGDNLPAKKKEDILDLPMVSEPRCKVCKSPYRARIELLIANGYSNTAISQQLMEAVQDIGYRSIQRHTDNHMALKEKSFRQIMEKQARELTEAEAAGTIRIVSGKAWLDMFVQQATDLLISGEMMIEARDVVKAIELRDAMEKEGINIFQEQIMVELRAIIQAMREIIAPEIAREISIRAKELATDMRHSELEAGTQDAEYEVVE